MKSFLYCFGILFCPYFAFKTHSIVSLHMCVSVCLCKYYKTRLNAMFRDQMDCKFCELVCQITQSTRSIDARNRRLYYEQFMFLKLWNVTEFKEIKEKMNHFCCNRMKCFQNKSNLNSILFRTFFFSLLSMYTLNEWYVHSVFTKPCVVEQKKYQITPLRNGCVQFNCTKFCSLFSHNCVSIQWIII